MAERGHETTDIDIGRTLKVAAAIVGSILLATAATLGFLKLFSAESPPVAPSPFTRKGSAAPPRLEGTPSREWEDMKAKQRQILESYGWIDRDAGTVRIPIERAMERLAAQGGAARRTQGK